jgi:hypothetical protein
MIYGFEDYEEGGFGRRMDMGGAEHARLHARCDHRRPVNHAVLEAASMGVVLLVVKAWQVRSPARAR